MYLTACPWIHPSSIGLNFCIVIMFLIICSSISFFLLNCIIKLYLCNIVVCDNKYMTPEIILISFFWVKLMIKVTYSEKECSLYWEHGNHNQNTFHFPVHLSQFEKHWGKISPIQLSHFDCHYSDLVDKKLRI